MTKDSDYYKVLKYLQGFQNDSGYQDIEHLLGKDRSYQISAYYKRVIEQMVLDGLIEIQMGSGSNNLPGIYINGKQTDHSIDSSYRNLKGRITMKGLEKYSKIMEDKKPSMNIEITNSPNSIIGQGTEVNQSHLSNSSSEIPIKPEHIQNTPKHKFQIDKTNKNNSPTLNGQRIKIILGVISIILTIMGYVFKWLKIF